MDDFIGPLFYEVPANPEKSYYDPNFGKSNNSVISGDYSPDFSQLVDQIEKNNLWSAEQAQKQMDFQERLFHEANDFNSAQAEVNRDFQQESADRAMAFSSAENEANRSWQKMMSDTAHQREMADLKAAGLNPILAANNGSSAGVGSAAMSAQAAGHAASSIGSPSGAKGDTDESGTLAIAQLMGKMLDNQTEIQKMLVSAETAKQTAEMYTGATRYAAELGQIASDIASGRNYDASLHASDLSYAAAMADPMRIIGTELAEFINAFGQNGYTAENAGNKTNSLVDAGAKIVADVMKPKYGKERTEQYIDTGGTGLKIGHIGASIVNGFKKIFAK